MELTHFDEQGQAIMVDVSQKEITHRTACATGRIRVCQEIFARLQAGAIAKGDVLGVARIAGIMAAKRTSELIPLCHLLPLSKCSIDFELEPGDEPAVRCYCQVRTEGKTGVEMEALTGVQVALLTVYDMCKAVDKSMVIEDVHLVEKTGGKSGVYKWSQ